MHRQLGVINHGRNGGDSQNDGDGRYPASTRVFGEEPDQQIEHERREEDGLRERMRTEEDADVVDREQQKGTERCDDGGSVATGDVPNGQWDENEENGRKAE